MVNSKKLKALFIENGVTQKNVAEKLGISKASLNNKILNKNDFKTREIQGLCDILKIKDKESIFFALDVENNSTN